MRGNSILKYGFAKYSFCRFVQAKTPINYCIFVWVSAAKKSTTLSATRGAGLVQIANALTEILMNLAIWTNHR
jgi:hypothetical protein